MAKDNSGHPGTAARDPSAIVVGIAALTLGVVWNEAVLGALFSPDGNIERTSWRFAIALADLALIGYGIRGIIKRPGFPHIVVGVAMVSASLSLGVGFLLAADVAVGWLVPGPPPVERSITQLSPLQIGPQASHAGPGRNRATARFLDGRQIYDVVYTIDSLGRRETPVDGVRDRHLIVAGGSFTYGEGVEDNETLPYYLGTLTTTYRPYNYGLRGGAPADALNRFEQRAMTDEVREEEGVMIYLIIADHIGRTVGAMGTMAWGEGKIHYELTPSGELEFKGTFAEARPMRTYLYHQLGRRNIVRAMNLRIPRYSARHAYLTARVVEEVANQYKRQFPRGRFYVVFYPHLSEMERGGSDPRVTALIREFERMQIEYLVYPTLFRDLGEWVTGPSPWRLEGDEHPTPGAYHALAEVVVRDLGLS